MRYGMCNLRGRRMSKSKAAAGLEVPRTAWTPREVAVSLNVDYEAVLEWIHAGELDHFKVGTHFRVPHTALLAFIDKRVDETKQQLAS